MFIDKSELKLIPIVSYLSSIGIKEESINGNRYLYRSPITNERTPSFYVNTKENLFDCYSSGSKGDIIQLVMEMHRCNFKDALERLKTGDLSRTSFLCCKPVEKESKLIVTKVLPISNRNLISYVESRGISFEIANRWLKQIHCTNKGKSYYYVGFLNDANGYELRNGLGFKIKTANGITTVDKNTTTINLFEGFFDYLSALQYYDTVEPHKTTVILNTTVNVKAFAEKFDNNYTVNAYLDNDKSGLKAVESLISKGFKVVNKSSELYPNCKDFNDYIVNKPP